MLEVKIDDNHNLRDLVVARSSTTELAAEVALLINTIYNGIRQSSPEGAALFKRLISHVVDDDCPVWDERPIDVVSVTIPLYSEGKNDD